MQKYFPQNPFERYADDIIVHCRSEEQAQRLLTDIAKRMASFELTLHAEKTKVVYCGRGACVKGTHQQFDFLGFTFRKRAAKDKCGNVFTGFLPAISNKAKKSITQSMRLWKVRSLNRLTLEQVSNQLNPQIRGWINYYGVFYKAAMNRLIGFIELRLIRWVQVKYSKKLTSKSKAIAWLNRIKSLCPRLFAHWQM
jgi:RNA-directed DNA polymerase